jgi:hypothetical protein
MTDRPEILVCHASCGSDLTEGAPSAGVFTNEFARAYAEDFVLSLCDAEVLLAAIEAEPGDLSTGCLTT